MIIPNKVIAAALVIGLPLRLLIHDQPISHYLIGFVAAGCLLYGIGIVGQLIFKKEALGGGDLKLFAFIGLMLGIKLTLLTLFIACLLGSIVGLLLIRSGILKRDEYISFGPFIALGAVLSCWWGETWIDWYLHLLLNPIKF
jgi:prepilin signal peptidase PulO-like enzyme (type II secretory pathway)